MKKFFLFSMIILGSLAAFAQSDKYTAAMKKNIPMIDSAFSNPDVFLALANNFERIAVAEKSQWLPYYYAAYCRLNFGFMQKDQSANDEIADKASDLLQKADSLKPANSEISCLKSMTASMRLMVNPQQRYMKYGVMSDNFLKQAKEQDPTNPRPHMLKGQNLKYTPEQFGGGCGTAKPELEAAAAKFSSFKPASDLDPNWGKTYNDKLLQECQ